MVGVIHSSLKKQKDHYPENNGLSVFFVTQLRFFLESCDVIFLFLCAISYILNLFCVAIAKEQTDKFMLIYNQEADFGTEQF